MTDHSELSSRPITATLASVEPVERFRKESRVSRTSSRTPHSTRTYHKRNTIVREDEHENDEDDFDGVELTNVRLNRFGSSRSESDTIPIVPLTPQTPLTTMRTKGIATRLSSIERIPSRSRLNSHIIRQASIERITEDSSWTSPPATTDPSRALLMSPPSYRFSRTYDNRVTRTT